MKELNRGGGETVKRREIFLFLPQTDADRRRRKGGLCPAFIDLIPFSRQDAKGLIFQLFHLCAFARVLCVSNKTTVGRVHPTWL
jgi:hypothetical protein